MGRKKSENLSPTAIKIFRFMIGYQQRAKGCPPSIREIVDSVGVSSPSNVLFHIKKLEERGMVERVHSVGRRSHYVVSDGEWKYAQQEN